MLKVSEFKACGALVAYAKLKRLPLLHIANEGKRNPTYSAAMGIIAGVCDYLLPIPSGEKAGLWIEMKAPGKRPTRKQEVFMELMRRNGYQAVWFDDWVKAANYIDGYLKQPKDDNS